METSYPKRSAVRILLPHLRLKRCEELALVFVQLNNEAPARHPE